MNSNNTTNKEERYSIPSKNISIEKAISTLLKQSENFLATFLNRLVYLLPTSQFLTLTRYVEDRKNARKEE